MSVCLYLFDHEISAVFRKLSISVLSEPLLIDLEWLNIYHLCFGVDFV